MPELDKNLFVGKEQISATEWETLTSTDAGQQAIGEFLESFGWDQKAAGSVVLQLEADNRSVAAASLRLAGRWTDGPVKLQAKKLFPTMPENIILSIDLDDLSIFRFSPNEMWSDYVCGDNIKHEYVLHSGETAAVLEEDERQDYDIGRFCIRAVTSVAKDSGVKWGLSTSILIFPASGDEMAEVSTAYIDPGWPGVKLADGQMPILPPAGKAQRALNGKAWGNIYYCRTHILFYRESNVQRNVILLTVTNVV